MKTPVKLFVLKQRSIPPTKAKSILTLVSKLKLDFK